MKHNIEKIKASVINFFSDPSNYANYGQDIRSTDCLFAKIYDELPQRTYLMLYDEEKGFYFSPYYNHKVQKVMPDNKKVNYDDFLVKIKEKLTNDGIPFIIGSTTSDDTFIITEQGFIDLGVETSSGTVKKFSIHPLLDEKEIVDWLGNIVLSSLVVTDVDQMEKNHYKIAFLSDGMIDTIESSFKDWTTNIELNYNDDVPYQEINEEVQKEKSSLIMLYGVPGTGKSSLIKSIVNDNLNKEFIYIDSPLLTSLSNGQFLEFLNDHRGSVFILEDCEKAILDRETSGNDTINTILNITDGIVAESLNCKLICTFNCGIDKIDKALLRAGRLSILYEFKPLTVEKAKAIYPEATKEMTLADAHNATVKTDFRTKTQKKIGF